MRTVESAFRRPFVSGVTPRREITQRSIARTVVRERDAAVRPVSGPSSLTPRELDVMWALADGGTYKETAYRLGVTEQTVKNHATDVYRKLGVHGLVEAFGALGWLVPS